MVRRRRPAWAPVLVAVATALATPCFVEAPACAAAGENADAKAAWEKGKTLARQKKWDAAADAFREASVMSPNPQYKLDLARALLSAGKPSEASRALDDLDAAKDVGPGVRAAAAKVREQAEKKLATIAVTVTGGGGRAVLELDGKRVKSGDANRVDPGKHQIRAHADGWIPIEMNLEIAAGKTESVPFKLEPDPNAASEEPPAQETPPPAEDDGGGTLLPAAVAWGVSAVGFGVGGIFGIFAFDEADKARESCDGDRCTEAARDAIGTSKINGGISTVGFAVGGAALVTGIVLAVVYGSDASAEATAAVGPKRFTVTPWIGGTSAGVDGSF